MGRVKDLIGDRYGRWLVICLVPQRAWKGSSTWFCLCDCGKSRAVVGGNLRSGGSESCGCLNREISILSNTLHGLSGNRLRKVLLGAINRCEQESNNSYVNYGAREIRVCQEWKSNPQAFVYWAQANGYEEGLQIDRIDNDGDYKPENCRFVTPYVNNHNKCRLMKTNNSGYAGVSPTEWGTFVAQIQSKLLNKGNNIHLGTYPTAYSACQKRNEFIKENNLPHRIQEKLK